MRPRPSTPLVAIIAALALAACTRKPAPNGGLQAAPKEDAGAPTLAGPVLPFGATDCSREGSPPCFRFDTTAHAFQWILTKEPLVLAVGEAHAQRGTEAIASATKRFTDALLPLVAPVASDVVVELWAPDPKCAKEVKQVASAQKPVTAVQAETNQNEYVALGTAAKSAGMTPWLLRPTCDDFTMLADAGDDAVSAMLGLVKRLTQAKVAQLYGKARSSGSEKVVIAYGGALHNDLTPPEATAAYSFGPDLDRLTGGRYVELDLIVPEYVKKAPVWEKLPWYASFESDRAHGPTDKTTVYRLGERSFVLIFPASGTGGPQGAGAEPQK